MQEWRSGAADQYLVERNTFASELVNVAAGEPGLKLALGTAVVDVHFEEQTLDVSSTHMDLSSADDSYRAADAFAAAAADTAAARCTTADLSEGGDAQSHAEPGVGLDGGDTAAAPDKYDSTLSYDLLIAADGAFSQVCGPTP